MSEIDEALDNGISVQYQTSTLYTMYR